MVLYETLNLLSSSCNLDEKAFTTYASSVKKYLSASHFQLKCTKLDLYSQPISIKDSLTEFAEAVQKEDLDRSNVPRNIGHRQDPVAAARSRRPMMQRAAQCGVYGIARLGGWHCCSDCYHCRSLSGPHCSALNTHNEIIQLFTPNRVLQLFLLK